MKTPVITTIYAGIFMLMYLALTFNVIRYRRGRKVSLGDGGDTDLRNAVRIHSNFIEYVPFVLLLIGFLELTGLGRLWIHVLLLMLLAGRLLHPVGMVAKPGSSQFYARGAGMVLTVTVMLAAALVAIFRLALGGADLP